VQGVWAIKDLGYEAIIINNNPETVSTDFDTSDKLYFEALHIDDVMNVIKKERPEGVILQFGGQTSLNLAEALNRRGIRILGTSFASIDLAEDRRKFSDLLGELGILTPPGRSVTDVAQARQAVDELGYPLVVRPSYVIGGRSMQIVYSDAELMEYLTEAVSLGTDRPVLIDRYIEGKEVEVDAIADGEDILIPGIMEHIERTGVHSGDSISVYPPHTIPDDVCDLLVSYTRRVTKALGVIGLLNVQYAWDGRDVFVIEVNPRASRTVPIMSKVTGVPMVRLAVGAMLGEKLANSEWGVGLYRKMPFSAVKMPVFSNAKLTDVDTAVGPEMKSTGEILAMDETYEKAVNKGFIATGLSIPTEGGVYVSLRESERSDHTAAVIRGYADAGFRLSASPGTAAYVRSRGMDCEDYAPADVKRAINDGRLHIVINAPRRMNVVESESFAIRRYATERGLPVLTCTDTAEAFLIAIGAKLAGRKAVYRTLEEYTNHAAYL
jgi:carbamoyl-phosphate synthase large subunit